MLVAQCTGASGASCDLPTGLPWYFGLAIALVWVLVVALAVAVGRRLLQTRRERRLRADRRRAPGTEVEPW